MVKYRLAGIGGSSALARLASGMVRRLDHGLQFLTGVERDDASGGDRNLLSGLGVAPGALGLFAELEIPEARQLDAATFLQRRADLLEEALDHVLGFALVQAQLLEEKIGPLGLRERHRGSSYRSVAPKRSCRVDRSSATIASLS